MAKVRYEYQRIGIKFGDMKELNKLGGEGWRLVQIVSQGSTYYAILEREAVN